MTTEAAATLPADSGVRHPGLFSRVFGVLFSPRETFTAVAARPRAIGALLVTAIAIIGCQMAFMSTEVGRNAVLEQQVRTMESFGMTVTDEMYAGMEASIDRSTYTITPIATLVFLPVVNALFAGLLVGIFSMLLGGAATFKQVNAVTAHAGIVVVIQQLFVMPLSYARGGIAGANLGIFVPMLDEKSFPVLFLGAIDLFYVWYFFVLAIGIGVLYKRSTGGVFTAFMGVYAFIALILAFVRSGS